MRGSGCSGGAFDLFDLPTTYDGYDAVEAVAAQTWVKGGKVGLAGISFSGITQLFVAGTQPPHLAAIAPMSVTDDIYTGTGYPGGIFNSGFAQVVDRGAHGRRQARARRAASRGRRRSSRRATSTARANQKLRLQTQNALKLQTLNPFRTPSLFAQRAPGAVAQARQRADVPGRPVPGRADRRPLRREPQVPERTTRTSGSRSRTACTPTRSGRRTITRWAEFLKLYVANEVPVDPARRCSSLERRALPVRSPTPPAAPVLQSRFAGMTERRRGQGDLQARPARARADGQRRRPAGPRLDRRAVGARLQRVAAEAGQGDAPTSSARGGALGAKPASAVAAEYIADPKARPRQTLPGDGAEDAWKAQPPYTWAPLAAGKGLGFTAAADQGPRDRRPVEPRRLPQVVARRTPTSR